MVDTTVKDIVRQIKHEASEALPISLPLFKSLESWAALHGWDANQPHFQELMLRQALVNTLASELNIHNTIRHFSSPTDMLKVRASTSLLEAAHEKLALGGLLWSYLYTELIPQSHRRQAGQFWTDDIVANWMVAWLLQSSPSHLTDICCGPGIFLQHAATLTSDLGKQTSLQGLDISPVLLNMASLLLPSSVDLLQCDYRESSHLNADAIVCNPPYTRHHDISPDWKDRLQATVKKSLGIDASRQGTLAYYFLLKLIAEIKHGASAAVIVPMEVFDARYGLQTRKALAQNAKIEALVHFSHEMNAFHKVDVGASIILFRKEAMKTNFVCHLTLKNLPTTQQFLRLLDPDTSKEEVTLYGEREFLPQDELTNEPKWFNLSGGHSQHIANEPALADGRVVKLKELAHIVRGIATGANGFFSLPDSAIRENNLEGHVVPTLQRNRDAQRLVFDEDQWKALSDAGKPVWLLYLSGKEVVTEPNVRQYLEYGENRGVHLGSLVGTRKKWFFMEQRDVPPIFFTILTRGRPRFILNRAGVRPLNMFSLLYPREKTLKSEDIPILWALLNSTYSTSKLRAVSRTYGGNTLKVEPRELDNLLVVNPLALPNDMKRRIGEAVSAYLETLEADSFLAKVDLAVEEFINDGSLELELLRPLQIAFIEPESEYLAASAPKSTTRRSRRSRPR